MPIIQQLINNDEMHRNLKKPAIIINDLMNSTSEDRDHIQRLITTTYSSDMVSTLPQCKCGETKGEYSKNTICPKCQTPVSSAIEDTIEPLVWFRRPNGVEKLFSPIVWIMLENRFSKSKFSVIRYLTDTSYAPQVNRPDVVNRIEEAGIKRGYNNFVQNFFQIVSFLMTLKDFKPKRGVTDYLDRFLKDNKDILFSDYIPLLNKTLLVIEKTSLATYIDSTVPLALDPLEMLISIDRDFYDQNSLVKENRTARAMHALSNGFFAAYFKEIVASKPGLLRHYIGGSRFDYSARAVISSITWNHRYDEIEIPWGIGLTIFRPMLISKLTKKSGMLENEAVCMLLYHVGKYHPLLDHYLKEVIAETEGGRYPVLINRFPSLLQGSIQKVFIPRVKTDPDDKTIGISILCTTAPNADFDGDQMSIYLSLDKKMASMWDSLAPKYNIWEMSDPLKISSNIKLAKPIIATAGIWLAEEDENMPQVA